MSTTAKLTYLDNTKNLLKNRLNSLGAEITSSTTFRNYLTWLDTFYEEVGDKTDIATNGIVGRTSQDSAPSPGSPRQVNNLTGNVAYKITTQNEEQTFTIPLGDIELCDIDTYEDKIYSSDGRFYLEKKIGKTIINGTETTITMDEKPAGLTYYSCNIYNINFTKPSSKCYCDKLAYSVNSIYLDDIQGIKPTSNGKIKIKVFDSSLSTVDLYKAWLSNNNLLVYYVLNTPTTTEITSSNYPALYTVLKEIQDYLTSYKINKEFILNYSSAVIEY